MTYKHRPSPPDVWYSVYLLYWYKSTNTSANLRNKRSWSASVSCFTCSTLRSHIRAYMCPHVTICVSSYYYLRTIESVPQHEGHRWVVDDMLTLIKDTEWHIGNLQVTTVHETRAQHFRCAEQHLGTPLALNSARGAYGGDGARAERADSQRDGQATTSSTCWLAQVRLKRRTSLSRS